MKEVLAKIKPVLSPSLLLALVTMLVILVSCSGQASYTDVTVEEAREMIVQQEVVLLDVRNVEEYNSSHIPGAILIPLDELESRLAELNPSSYILVYCSTGGCQSEKAPRILVSNDFIHVWNLKGGFVQWKVQGFPVTQ